ncbi:phosphate uptake regulator PhoU [Candidatus Woesearchaeota archaeon]|nr:phosphate uptake regulator PhoU [Candidatus Woesearchaeota archaeon]MBI2660721.1 phosphate uptake regulator PhoU [Candidatus Woesearchaeota archaeon]
MKRRVVQHGPSTLIISLPSKWVRERNVKKGDEIDVSEVDDKIVISSNATKPHEVLAFNITPFGAMIPRTIYSLYKRGTEELRLAYDSPGCFQAIADSLTNEAAGFELLESGNKHCVIRNISEGKKEFDRVLKQTFQLLVSMADEGYNDMVNGRFEHLRELIPLERTNNRFTTFCRRYINTSWSGDAKKIGSMYYIVETLEKIADEYKYLYMFFGAYKNSISINRQLLEIFGEINGRLLRKFYELFYKFDPKLASEIKSSRDKFVKDLTKTSATIKQHHNIVLYHHLMALTTLIFSLLDNYLVFAVAENYSTAKPDERYLAATL